MSERDWKAFSVTMGDFETRASPLMADGEVRRGSIFVIADGDPGLICPIWSDISDSGRVEAIVEIDAFAAVVARIPASHPANLVEAFPRPLELNRYLGSATAAGLFATATLAAFAFGDMSQARKENELGGEHIRVLRDRVDRLNRNQIEMARLRSEAPDAPWSTVGGHKALIGLASSIPDPVTLTSLKMGRDGGFELEAIVVGPGFNQDETRQMLSRFGFNPNAGNGWAFDTVAGRLVVRGTYKETAL
jgi:hypothetical protein